MAAQDSAAGRLRPTAPDDPGRRPGQAGTLKLAWETMRHRSTSQRNTLSRGASVVRYWVLSICVFASSCHRRVRRSPACTAVDSGPILNDVTVDGFARYSDFVAPVPSARWSWNDGSRKAARPFVSLVWSKVRNFVASFSPAASGSLSLGADAADTGPAVNTTNASV